MSASKRANRRASSPLAQNFLPDSWLFFTIVPYAFSSVQPLFLTLCILTHKVFSSLSLQRVITPNNIAGRLRPIKFYRTRIIRISITITISFTITMGLTTFTKEAYSIVSLKACKCVCACAIVLTCVCGGPESSRSVLRWV